MNKKILYTAILLLVTIGLGIAIYFVFFRERVIPLPPQETPTNQATTGLPEAKPGTPGTPGEAGKPPAVELPTIAQGGPTTTKELSPNVVRGTTLSRDGKGMNYYDMTDGKFYTVDASGAKRALTDKQFPNVSNITWAQQSDKAILEFPDGANVVYDFESKKQVTLPKHWEGFDFSPQGDQIAAKSIGLNENNRWLVLASADGTRAEAVQALGENADKVTVSWSPSDQVVGFSATGKAQGFDTNEVYLIGKNQENFKSLMVEGRGFQPLWNKDGKQLIYSVYNSQNNYKPSLWLVDAQGEDIGKNRTAIGLSTWAEKCTFTSESVAYCAVPTSMPDGYGMQPELAKDIPDNVYRVDIKTGAKSLIGAPAEGSSMSNLQVSADGQNLFFTDNRTGLLREMRLR